MGTAREYAIHQVLHEEISDGHVWLTDNENIVWKDCNANEKSRIVVMIKRTEKRFAPVVYCDALFCDEGYIRRRDKRLCENGGRKEFREHDKKCLECIKPCKGNLEGCKCKEPFKVSLDSDGREEKDSIMLSAYYRDKLKIASDLKDVKLEIKKCGFLGHIRACFDHPQVVVRVAAWMGVVGGLLGLESVLLGVAGVACGLVKFSQFESNATSWLVIVGFTAMFLLLPFGLVGLIKGRRF